MSVQDLIRENCVPLVANTSEQWLAALTLEPDCIQPSPDGLRRGKERGFRSVDLYTKYSTPEGSIGHPMLRVGGRQALSTGGFRLDTFSSRGIDHGCGELKKGKLSDYTKYVTTFGLPSAKRKLVARVDAESPLYQFLGKLTELGNKYWHQLGGDDLDDGTFGAFNPVVFSYKAADGPMRWYWKLFVEFDKVHKIWSDADEETISTKKAARREVDRADRTPAALKFLDKLEAEREASRSLRAYMVTKWDGEDPVLDQEIFDMRPYIADITADKSDNTKDEFRYFSDVEIREIATTKAPAATVKCYIRNLYIVPVTQGTQAADPSQIRKARAWSVPSAAVAPPRVLSEMEKAAAEEAMAGMMDDEAETTAAADDAPDATADDKLPTHEQDEPLPLVNEKKRAREEDADEPQQDPLNTDDALPDAKRTCDVPIVDADFEAKAE